MYVGRSFSSGGEGFSPGEAYSDSQARALAVMERDETHGATPEAVARLVYRIITARSPGVRYAVGPVSEKAALLLLFQSATLIAAAATSGRL